jgi:hypothetical protein
MDNQNSQSIRKRDEWYESSLVDWAQVCAKMYAESWHEYCEEMEYLLSDHPINKLLAGRP